MSVLYPRLLDRAARELHEEYARLPVGELGHRAALRHPATVFAATGGRQVSRGELEGLRNGLLELARAAGHPRQPSRHARSDFDTATARLLHERSGLVAGEAAARDAWAFLALVVAPDIAYWRFPNPPRDRILGTDITRHVFGRLWWRAHLLEQSGRPADRYELLDSFGEAAFDQIFARRRAVASSRALVRALARAWPRQDLAGLNERDVLRDSLKRFVRLEAVIDFESLDDFLLDAQVTETLAETARHLADASGRRPDHRHARRVQHEDRDPDTGAA
jgi:hypothetical protein